MYVLVFIYLFNYFLNILIVIVKKKNVINVRVICFGLKHKLLNFYVQCDFDIRSTMKRIFAIINFSYSYMNPEFLNIEIYLQVKKKNHISTVDCEFRRFAAE